MPQTPEDRTAELWRLIVEIHNRSKARLIYCEEAEVEHKTFLQPRNELCNALEHIIRAKAHEFGVGPQGVGNGYANDTLDKALGHEFRAFYDISDWLSIILREQISEELSRYAPDVIQKVIPDYYSKIRPQLETLPGRIASLRAKKDIKGDILTEVAEYDKIVDELMAFRIALISRIPSLEEVKRGESRKHLWVFIGIFLSGLVGAAIKWAWDKSHS